MDWWTIKYDAQSCLYPLVGARQRSCSGAFRHRLNQSDLGVRGDFLTFFCHFFNFVKAIVARRGSALQAYSCSGIAFSVPCGLTSLLWFQQLPSQSAIVRGFSSDGYEIFEGLVACLE